ncbi:DUF6114 domain-containing protein [Streptomyces sp. BE20]|uniref:DUF6114 domain-containing protein n=1 Tax=Streptomyces sp. BE20 TaxID=3002525 RepID=UPI002E779689|nr:DUF6114 domain-containing protein [Streptomyces sp. BE20]MEE1824782.1 DUF6114 domain-containing protein [Streptomyces sp. BE20]
MAEPEPTAGPAPGNASAGQDGRPSSDQDGRPTAGQAVEERPARTGARPGRRGWRGRRPFWGGLLVLLGGTEILFTLRAPLPVVLHIGLQGLAGYLVPSVMTLCGLLILFNPAQRLFYSIVAVLASLGSWLTSNLGGFLIGMLLGVVGSCLTFGWLPDQPPRRRLLRRGSGRRKAARPAGA